VAGLGGTVKTLDFETHPEGPLQSSFYLTSDGVTLTEVGDLDQVFFTTGSIGGSDTPPLSDGEGTFTGSRVVGTGQVDASQFTISFDRPVWGAGLFVVDLYNPGGVNTATLAAYDGPDGTGTLLGTASAAGFNFQTDRRYFMGVGDDAGTIRSVVFTDGSYLTDGIWLDDVMFAATASPVVPSTWGRVKALSR
jgi:hypothetical protein